MKNFLNRRAPTRRVVLTEDVVKIAGQQGQYAVEHGCCFLLFGPCAACANVSGGLNLSLFADVHRRLLLSQFHNESYEFRRPVRLLSSLRRTGHQRSPEPLSALRTSRCVPRLGRIAVDRQRTQHDKRPRATMGLANPILAAVHDDCLTGDKGGIVAC